MLVESMTKTSEESTRALPSTPAHTVGSRKFELAAGGGEASPGCACDCRMSANIALPSAGIAPGNMEMPAMAPPARADCSWGWEGWGES